MRGLEKVHGGPFRTNMVENSSLLCFTIFFQVTRRILYPPCSHFLYFHATIGGRSTTLHPSSFHFHTTGLFHSQVKPKQWGGWVFNTLTVAVSKKQQSM